MTDSGWGGMIPALQCSHLCVIPSAGPRQRDLAKVRRRHTAVTLRAMQPRLAGCPICFPPAPRLALKKRAALDHHPREDVW